MPDIEFRIIPPKKWMPVDWAELWKHRELFLVLAWKNISIRYKQTAIGIFWAVIQPIITMVIFTFIFHRVGRIQSDQDIPYSLFLFSGLLFWQYYSSAVTTATESLIENSVLVQKTYFPRVILPFSSIITGLADFFISAGIFLCMLAYYRYLPGLSCIFILPVALFSVILSAAGLGCIFSAINIKYRDARYALPFFIQLLMFVTPVIYPVSLLDRYPLIKELMLWLNPVSGTIATVRASLFGKGIIDWHIFGVSIFMSVVFFIVGIYYFKKVEQYFADII